MFRDVPACSGMFHVLGFIDPFYDRYPAFGWSPVKRDDASFRGKKKVTSLPDSTALAYALIRDFKIQRRGRTRTSNQLIGFTSKTTTVHVHHAFLYISLPVFARLRRENA